MSIRSHLVLAFSLLLSLPVFAQLESAPIDIIFDIDWTAFYSVDPKDKNQADKNIIFIQEKAYRPTDHLGEVLEKLSSNPQVRISFFSGGERARNESLLRSFKLPSGKSAYDISFKILSKENLTEVSTDSSLTFSERYKKVITGLIADATPERTILIDDQVNFSVKPWRAVNSLGFFNFQVTFDPSKADKEFYPKTGVDWRNERDKSLIWLSLIEESIRRSQISNESFSQTTEELWLSKSFHGLCKNIFVN